MVSALVKLPFFLLVLAFQKIKTVFSHHWVFFCSKLLLCWRFSCWSAYRWNHGQVRGLLFLQRLRDIIAICCYWQEHFDLRWGGQEAHCQPPPQLSQPCRAEEGIAAGPPVFRWAGHRQQVGVVQQEPRWGTASTSWQPQCRNSSGGRCSSSLASQLPSNLHRENPGLQAQGGHNPSSLTCCRNWSSCGHFRKPAAAIWGNWHKQERHMYRWLQA